MSCLVLHLTGPMQSWGVHGRFDKRDTNPFPSKSAVVGFLGSALGRERGADMSDLAALHMAVRVDRPGQLTRDYHTAGGAYPDHRRMPKASGGRHNMTVQTERWYLADAAFTVALAGDPALIGACAEALRHPRWPLFLGRRACAPVGPVVLGVLDERDPVAALTRHVPAIGGNSPERRVVTEDAEGALSPIRDQPERTLNQRYQGRRLTDQIRLVNDLVATADEAFALVSTGER